MGFLDAVWLNVFVIVILALVPEIEHIFLSQNHSNDPDCNTLIKAKELLSKQDKQSLDCAKPLH